MDDSASFEHADDQAGGALTGPSLAPAAVDGTDQLPLPAPLLDYDLPCRTCGYNLRGLPSEGACPECGSAIENSLQTDLLRFNEPAQLRRMSRGFSFIYGAVFYAMAMTLLFIIGMVFVGVWGMQGLPPFWEWCVTILGFLIAIPILVFPILYPLGCWWATAPDPIDAPMIRKSKIYLRWTAIILPFVILLSNSIVSLAFNLGGSGPMLTELVTHLVFVLIWVHILSLIRITNALFYRCRPAQVPRRQETHKKSLKRGLSWSRGFPAILLLLHWLAVIWSLTMAQGGPGAGFGMGFGYGAGVGFFWIVILWLSQVGMVNYIIKPVKGELLIAMGLSSQTESGEEPKSAVGWRRLFALKRST